MLLPPVQKLVVFSICEYKSIAFIVTKTVFPQIILDNYFTHLVFWILHEMDMIKP